MQKYNYNTPLRCALLVERNTNWYNDTLFACPNIELFSLTREQLGLSDLPNPYSLKPVEKPDAILVCTNWYRWLKTKGETETERVFNILRKISPVVAGVEGFAHFGLGITPDGLDRYDFLLKGQGVYKDRELYNYDTGTQYPGANWTQKIYKSAIQYNASQLDKIRMSFPCFIATHRKIRHIVRGVKPNISSFSRWLRFAGDLYFKAETAIIKKRNKHPCKLVHCYGQLTHIQRLELLITLKENNINGLHGLSSIPKTVYGIRNESGELTSTELEEIEITIKQFSIPVAPLTRNKFLKTMLEHKAVIALTGYGELSFRQAETWMSERLLICQDLSHVQTMFPFENNRNAVYCKPDLSDIISVLKDIQSGKTDYEKIAGQGYNDWCNWIQNYKTHLFSSVTAHLRKQCPAET